MSDLSTVAIKDGHRGHFPNHHQPVEAERADRISRLAGLERVAVTGRNLHNLNPGTAANPPGYFDGSNQTQIYRERSTVGSASATGSVGGRTTWASGSEAHDPDRMSEDQDNETSSMGGFSDEAASLVGFGEGARTPARQHSQVGSGSPAVGKASAVPQYLRDQPPGSTMTGMSSSGTTQTISSMEQYKQDAKMIDGLTYDEGVVDTANRTPTLTGQGERGTAQQVIQERMRRRGTTPQDQDAMDYE